MPTTLCPRCGSDDIAPITGAAADIPRGDELTAHVDPHRAEPPNSRCNRCNHAWWLAPRRPNISPANDGVDH